MRVRYEGGVMDRDSDRVRDKVRDRVRDKGDMRGPGSHHLRNDTLHRRW